MSSNIKVTECGRGETDMDTSYESDVNNMAQTAANFPRIQVPHQHSKPHLLGEANNHSKNNPHHDTNTIEEYLNGKIDSTNHIRVSMASDYVESWFPAIQ